MGKGGGGIGLKGKGMEGMKKRKGKGSKMTPHCFQLCLYISKATLYLTCSGVRNSQPLVADESISDMATETQAVNELCSRIQHGLESLLQIG